jgi:hypothetical protein
MSGIFWVLVVIAVILLVSCVLLFDWNNYSVYSH